jgi:hypothetical protein
MKRSALALALILGGGCTTGTVQWVRAPEVSEPACTASCNDHYEQCPKIFAGFPERGAVECPAEHDNCLKACRNAPSRVATAAAPMAPVPAAPAAVRPVVGSKEARLRELKHYYDEGLVNEDVYRDRQKAILAEP